MPFDPLKFISMRYSGRKPSAIRSIVQKNMGVPGMLSLAGGLPNPAVFPFSGMKVTVAGGKELEVPADQVKACLQYSASVGMPKLHRQLVGMQKRYHSPVVDTKLLIGTGSQSLLSQGFDMLLNRGDTLLVEAPTYPGALAALQPLQPSFVTIGTDADGLIPEKLADILDSWDAAKGAKPRVLYTIPTGQNPSGATIPAARRQQIYQIAQKHDLVIIEDDPYYFLYLEKPEEQPVSFLSMDTDGRVLRFDSLSKVLSSGMRLGFVTGHPAFIDAIEKDVQGTALHTSNISQAVVSTLLEEWGDAGWEEHLTKVRSFYKQRRDVFLAAADRHLKGLARWTVPDAGMFVFFEFEGVSDTMDLIANKAREEKVLLVPGQSFDALDRPSNACRASYSLASDEDIDEALRRLASLLRSVREA